jgi:hypothetical protein
MMSHQNAKPIMFCLALLMLSLIPGCARTGNSQNGSDQTGGGSGTPPTFADAQTAATQSLATFKKLVTADNFRELGFDSADQVAKANLGAPLRIYVVKLDQLREYEPSKDANSLLSESPQMYYPVTVDGQSRSSIVVEQVEGRWRSASFGNAGLAKQIASISRANTAEASAASTQVMVQIPALGVFFLGSRNADNKLSLTSLAASDALGLKAGTTESAEQVFARLAPIAKNYNGLPM